MVEWTTEWPNDRVTEWPDDRMRMADSLNALMTEYMFEWLNDWVI